MKQTSALNWLIPLITILAVIIAENWKKVKHETK
jgi:hypothetical protein